MWTVLDHLLIGTDDDARDLETLTQNGVSHVLNCALELASYYPDSFEYLRLDLKDPDIRFEDTIDSAINFIEAADGGRVFVHCQGALSRSPSVVLAYLCHSGMPLRNAARHLSTVLRTKPNAIFLEQLIKRYANRSISVGGLHEVLGSSPTN